MGQTRVRMTSAEINLAKAIGRKRFEAGNFRSTNDFHLYDNDGCFVHEIGMIGEIAVAKHFNVYPDLDVKMKQGTEDGLLFGWRYDVKTTHYPNGKLLSSQKVNDDVEVYILCIAPVKELDWEAMKVVTLCGYAFQHELCSEENKSNLGRGVNYTMDQSQLHTNFTDLDYLRPKVY